MIDYLVASTICLGTLFLVYWLLLSKQRLFTFNRFFLLCALVFSFMVPLLEIDIPYAFDHYLIKDISSIELDHSNSDQLKEESAMVGDSDQKRFGWTELLAGLYILGFGLMLFRLIRNFHRLNVLKRNGREVLWKGYLLVLTKENINPFSFLQRIYMQDQILDNIDEDILHHEFVHVRNRHSYDILFIEILLVIFWFQPLLYLYKKSLAITHEYMADDLTISAKSGYQDYFRKIIENSNHHINFQLTSSFSFLSIKNRIKMTKKKNSSKRKVSVTVGTVMVVLLMLFTVFSFNLRPEGNISLKEKFVVILDAGHGGEDLGAQTESKLFEKDIALSISQKIANRLARKKNLEIRQTRDQDQYISLKDRISQTADADLFISIHVNEHNADNTLNYKHVLYAENQFKDLSLLTANALNQLAEKNGEQVKTEAAEFYVLQNANCPALLINVGFLSNPDNAEVLKTSKGQDKIADQISEAIGMTVIVRNSNSR